MAESLWGELPESGSETAISIIREQASFLSEQTNKLLIGQVDVSQDAFASTNKKQVFDVTLEIIAPAVESYSISILSFTCGLIDFPERIFDHVSDEVYQCFPDEEEFKKTIQSILRSRNVHRIVGTLLEQSKWKRKANLDA